MARTSACARSAARKLSATCQSFLYTGRAVPPTTKQFLFAKHNLPASAHPLLGKYGSGKLEDRVRNGAAEDWRGCQSPLKSEVWASSTASCNSYSLSSVNLVHGPSALFFQRSFSIWSPDTDTKGQDDSPKNEPVVDPHDGVSTVGPEGVPVVDGQWIERIYAKLMDGVKVVEDVVVPRVEETLVKYPVIWDISVPLVIFFGAWKILPSVLRRLHRYIEHGSAAVFKGLSEVPHVEVPYEQSVWQAMELPSRLFATILTMLQVGRLVAPNAIAAHYLIQFWAGGGILCFVFFLHNWKSNVLNRLLTTQPRTAAEKERYLTIDKFSSLGLVFIGALGLAEAYGLKIQSLLTVGGIGGVATAFAAKDILGNMLTGVSLSFSKPFSVGDQIKAGHVEGKVEEVGLHSTKLLNTEKNPIIVPNSFFQSQVIVNKTRAPWRALSVKIPVRLQDYEKVPIFTLRIRDMLSHHPQVHFGEDKPRCSIAQFTPSSIEIAISCNLKPMSKDEFHQVEQGILLEAASIITRSGAVLGERA